MSVHRLKNYCGDTVNKVFLKWNCKFTCICSFSICSYLELAYRITNLEIPEKLCLEN